MAAPKRKGKRMEISDSRRLPPLDSWQSFRACMEAHREVHGAEHFSRLLEQKAEESAELIQAVMKFRRHGGVLAEDRDNITAELVDVLICLTALFQSMPDNQARLFLTLINVKLEKWADAYEVNTEGGA